MSKPEPIPMDQLLRCVHCGLCTSACPTYLELGNEADSPRGRIHLMRAVAEGRLEWTAEVVGHLDLCLECRACETACPSGVQYGHLLEAARADIARSYRRPWRERVLLSLMRDALFPYPKRLKAALWPARAFGGLLRRMQGVLPGDVRHMLNLLPPGDHPAPPLPAVIPAQGKRRYRVALLTGCVGSVLFQSTNWATAHVLAANGCEVIVPKDQVCCGALHAHSGAPDTARQFARRNVDAFDLDGVDAVITNAAGCGSTLKEYGQLLAEDHEYAPRAARFAARVQDVSEFLAAIELVPPPRPVHRVVAYHDACHLAHGQGVRSQPRRLLAAIPGVRLVELRDADQCCGSAGLYNILQPDMAGRLLTKKVAAIRETGADTVATGNPGCLMQIAKGLREQGLAMDVCHPVELLAEAYGFQRRAGD